MNRYTWRTFLLELGMIAAALLFTTPFVVLVGVALRNPDGQRGPLDLTWPPTFEHLATAWQTSAMGSALVNSAAITLVSVALIVVVASTAAYPLARYAQRWSRGVFYFFLSGMLLAGQAAMLPLYTFIRDLGLVGSLWSVVLIHVGGSMPFCIFLYTFFIRESPRDYEEAAIIDGCSSSRVFVTVVFPLVRPITGTIVILQALGTWNDFFTPLLYLSGSDNKTAPLTLYNYVGEYGADWSLVFSALLLSIFPILILYFVAQKYIIRGFASGLKG
ncbi:carbohydrate ABC transporter permease [Ruania alba]|nr:carbohydrate ABC transporter permease [Ruania alba]